MEMRIQVGEWRVDRSTNELARGGDTLRIEPKAIEVLMALAGRAGEVVSREELMSAVWPGVIVGDEALTQSVIKLRRALGDDPRAPSYIETISKRGYRLIAPVRRGEAAGSPAAPPPARTRRRLALSALGAAALLALAAAAAVAIHRAAAPAAGAGMPGAAEAREAALPAVSVLPFESVGDGGAQSYLARGISNDLMTDLSRLPGLRLISASVATPGTAPGARYLVSGSVQRESGMLRINVRLVDGVSKQQLWSERFERPSGDLFAVQDEIARSLTAQLPARVSDDARRRRAKPYTRSLAAYDDFLRAQALFLLRQADENAQARGYYEKALELDPSFARAYAGLAMTYAMDFRLRPSGGDSPELARAYSLAQTARQIDPDIPEVYWAIGFVDAQSRRHEQAIEALRKAIELNRSYADAYALMGGIYTYIGQPQKSIALLRTAMHLKPDGGYLYFLVLGARLPVPERHRAGADQPARSRGAQPGRPRDARVSGRGAGRLGRPFRAGLGGGGNPRARASPSRRAAAENYPQPTSVLEPGQDCASCSRRPGLRPRAEAGAARGSKTRATQHLRRPAPALWATPRASGSQELDGSSADALWRSARLSAWYDKNCETQWFCRGPCPVLYAERGNEQGHAAQPIRHPQPTPRQRSVTCVSSQWEDDMKPPAMSESSFSARRANREARGRTKPKRARGARRVPASSSRSRHPDTPVGGPDRRSDWVEQDRGRCRAPRQCPACRPSLTGAEQHRRQPEGHRPD